ncbi:hypothetical protein NDU88_000705 [Pleurodeles waltl]|uniref:Uncharacterized protein n=1 Tax=Pleurodeles waltl TaxID=8319 RepID=A0AAV7SAT4_PLEWA|nr:hypothetical protein NDU88_000705 [Pleurodeles waltl]
MGCRARIAHTLSLLCSSCCRQGGPRPTQEPDDGPGGLDECCTAYRPTTGMLMVYRLFFAVSAASLRPPWAFGGSPLAKRAGRLGADEKYLENNAHLGSLVRGEGVPASTLWRESTGVSKWDSGGPTKGR